MVSKEFELQALREEAWLTRKMAEFAREHHMDVTIKITPMPEGERTPIAQPNIVIIRKRAPKALRYRNPYLNAPAGTKRCSSCRRFVSLAAYSRNKGTKDGLSYICKSCNTARAIKYRKKKKKQTKTKTK